MKIHTTRARIALLAGLAAVAFGLGGCAAPGAKTAGVSGERTAFGDGAFYADWYDATAVVLPPPPEATRR